jgi:hypothetical protein
VLDAAVGVVQLRDGLHLPLQLKGGRLKPTHHTSDHVRSRQIASDHIGSH